MNNNEQVAAATAVGAAAGLFVAGPIGMGVGASAAAAITVLANKVAGDEGSAPATSDSSDD